MPGTGDAAVNQTDTVVLKDIYKWDFRQEAFPAHLQYGGRRAWWEQCWCLCQEAWLLGHSAPYCLCVSQSKPLCFSGPRAPPGRPGVISCAGRCGIRWWTDLTCELPPKGLLGCLAPGSRRQEAREGSVDNFPHCYPFRAQSPEEGAPSSPVVGVSHLTSQGQLIPGL